MDLKKLSKEVDRRIRLSSGFTGSETKAIGNHEKEVEGGSMDAEQLEGAIKKRLAKLSANIASIVRSDWGRVEIQFDSSKNTFQVVSVNEDTGSVSRGKEFKDQSGALSEARSIASRPYK